MQVSPRVHDVLERLEETRGIYYNLARPSAEVLFLLARLTRPRDVVEVGTANGYSAIVLGAAVQPFGGRVVTIERSGRLAAMARENIVEAGLQDVVTVIPGSAYKVLKKLPGPFQFVFLDAAKTEYAGYLERLRAKLSPDALLVADNMLSHQDDVLPFLRAVEQDEGLMSVVLPVGMGLLVAANQEGLTERAHDVSSMKTLVADAEKRLFQGTAQDVRSGEIFFPAPAGARRAADDRTMSGYDTALAEEATRLPAE